MQPIWLTHRAENPNGASMIVLVDGVEAEDLESFARCADLFDGNDADAVEAARGRWRRAREAGHTLDLLAADGIGLGAKGVSGRRFAAGCRSPATLAITRGSPPSEKCG